MRTTPKRCLAIAVFLASAHLNAAPAGGNGTTIAGVIQPGGGVCIVDDMKSELPGAETCQDASTLNFVFAGNGKVYIGTAAHNFKKVGDRARLPHDTEEFGTVVFDSDSVDFAHPDTPPDLNDDKGALDFALIEIDKNRENDVSPKMLHWGGPTGYTEAAGATRPELGKRVLGYGNGAKSEVRDGIPGPRGVEPEGYLVSYTGQEFSSTIIEEGGDSGMPFLYGPTGAALGVGANCICGGTGNYPTIGYLLKVLAANGWSLKLKTAPPSNALKAVMGASG